MKKHGISNCSPASDFLFLLADLIANENSLRDCYEVLCVTDRKWHMEATEGKETVTQPAMQLAINSPSY